MTTTPTPPYPTPPWHALRLVYPDIELDTRVLSAIASEQCDTGAAIAIRCGDYASALNVYATSGYYSDVLEAKRQNCTETCPKHGPTHVTDSGSYSGYAGGSCHFTRLACGCTDRDESADVAAAI